MVHARVISEFKLHFLPCLLMRASWLAWVWIVAQFYFERRHTSDLQVDTSLLATELRDTRAALDRLELGQDLCDWRTWGLWVGLRLAVAVDCLLVLYLYLTRPVPQRLLPAVTEGDTGGASDSEDQTPSPSPATGGTTTSPAGKTRPTRPSDLRKRV